MRRSSLVSLSKSFEVLRTEVATFRYQITSSSSAVGCTRMHNKLVRDAVLKKVIELDYFKEKGAELKQRLNALQAKLWGLKVDLASLRWARRQLDPNAVQRGADLGNAMRCGFSAVHRWRHANGGGF